MGFFRTDLVGALPYPNGAEIARQAEPSEVEREVLQWFEEFRGPLLRYVLSFGVAVHDGEEVVQEVFLSLFQHLQARKPRKNLRGWLFRVAHNLALKQRHANRRLSDKTTYASVLIEMHSDPDANPEEQLWFQQRQRRLLTVFGILPEQDRWCLRLRAEGLRYREIAEVVGISLGAVSISLTRSLARLMLVDGR